MNTDEFGIEDIADEIAAGQCAVVAALVIALHEHGVLPQEKYSAALQRLWAEMPEAEAVGEAGAVVERVLDALDAGADTANPSHVGLQKQEVPAFAVRPVNDDAVARPAPTPFKAFIRAICGPARRA